jgi:hypothetical protein
LSPENALPPGFLGVVQLFEAGGSRGPNTENDVLNILVATNTLSNN